MDNRRNITSAGILLALSTLLGTGLLSLTNYHAVPYIAENERLRLLDSLSAVIPQALYDNDMITDTIQLSDQTLLGFEGPVTIYRARKNNEEKAIAFLVRAPDGYSGAIDLLVGILADGNLTGIRVISHKETPGLGDAIETGRSDWAKDFIGRSLNNPKDEGWKVKRDGGEFDQFTGATITPRAVVNSVYKALQFYDQQSRQVFVEKNLEEEG